MPGEIKIELDEKGKINTNTSFDLATTIVILEKLKAQLVERAKITSKETKD